MTPAEMMAEALRVLSWVAQDPSSFWSEHGQEGEEQIQKAITALATREAEEGKLPDSRMRGSGCADCHGWDEVDGTDDCGDCKGEPAPAHESGEIAERLERALLQRIVECDAWEQSQPLQHAIKKAREYLGSEDLAFEWLCKLRRIESGEYTEVNAKSAEVACWALTYFHACPDGEVCGKEWDPDMCYACWLAYLKGSE